jgi:uncharacterized protein YbbC (DUF1343 family)/CubicO group peptidase (beta-lactamase class C family)
LSAALRRAVSDSRAPGAVAYVGTPEKELLFEAVGFRQRVPVSHPTEKDTIYDLASLTKVLATTTAVLMLHDQGKIDLDQPVSELVPIPAFGRFTVRHLLTHTSGLPAILPLYKEVTTMNEALQRIAAAPLDWKPGARRRYSDLGFMILCKAVELTGRDAFDAFCRTHIYEPLGMTRTGFKPSKDWIKHCAATEQCPWRKKMMIGEVHDENAWAVGGVSGHAGLFGTAEDLARFCRGLLGGKLIAEKTLAAVRKIGQVPVYPWQGLGWWLDPWMAGSSGFLPSRAALGHVGFTGTSVWMDCDTGLFAILLSNNCHPSRTTRDNKTLRQVFHAALAECFYPKTWNTHTGLDRLMWDDFAGLRGKKVALLANNAAVDQLGRPILDVFALAPDVQLARIYSPEHGLRGQAEAGEKVASEAGTTPVTSLYGAQKRPKTEELKGIDCFLIDLPDVGSRYYTYPATMKECLAACAESHVHVRILDRPNPVGGTILEGPIAEQIGSPVCWAHVPVRHGMTLGEIARFLHETDAGIGGLKITVERVDAWLRERRFDACSLPWAAPSPNIPDAETALAYVGMCLFEGTNLNEGRGTERPFRQIGAPWLDAKAVIKALPESVRTGFALEALPYTPRAIPGKAAHPRFQDTACRGISLSVSDADACRPFSLAIALIAAIRRRHPKDFQWESSFDTLAGGPGLRTALEADTKIEDMLAQCAPALETFVTQRPRLYSTHAEWIDTPTWEPGKP